MRNCLRIGFLSAVVFVVFGFPPAVSGKPLVPIRSWQFHKLDADYVSRAMKLTGQYNVNTVVFSHGMIEDVSQLYKGDSRAEQLRKLASEAHALKLRVWIWVHELESDVPERYRPSGRVEIDMDGFWQWLQGKYEKLFADFPEFDGILLTFHETKYKIFDEGSVRSKLTMPQRFAKLINTLDAACTKHEKDFVVRSFLYEPQELQWFAEGLADVSPRVMLQCKCVPHDWQPFYPHNPMIGKFPDRRLIVEFDCSSEFTGRNRIPYTSAEYFEYRWRYALSRPGVVGYNARLDHAGYDALFTPNEANIYTLYRLSEDPDITAGEIWRQWSEQRYGKDAAEFVEQALRRSFEIVNKSYFVLEFWITNHSKLPSFGYADGHITSRTIAKWKPDEPKYAELEERLKHPDTKLLEEILAEKDQAVALADESLFYLSRAKPYLSAEQYDDLYRRLNLLRRVATVWKLHSEAFFGYKILAEGHEADGLKERVARAIEGLRYQAKASETAGLTSDPPAAAGEIRSVADELAGKLKKLND